MQDFEGEAQEEGGGGDHGGVPPVFLGFGCLFVCRCEALLCVISDHQISTPSPSYTYFQAQTNSTHQSLMVTFRYCTKNRRLPPSTTAPLPPPPPMKDEEEEMAPEWEEVTEPARCRGWWMLLLVLLVVVVVPRLLCMLYFV